MNRIRDESCVPSLRILVHSPNWIGDQILSYPFFYTLRQLYPQAWIGVCCKPWVRSIQFQNCVNQILPARTSPGFCPWNLWKQAGKQPWAWDIGIALPDSFSAAWQIYQSHIQRRWGYLTEWRGPLLTHSLRLPAEVQHRSEKYLHLLELDTIQQQPPPQVTSSFSWIRSCMQAFCPEFEWGSFSVLPPPEFLYWILAPGSMAISRRWPLEKWVTLARLIYAQTQWPGILIGGASESDMVHQLFNELGSPLVLKDFFLKGELPVYWKLFQRAQFVVCNDSGLAHYASLLSRYTQIIWGAGNPNLTLPLGPGKLQISQHQTACWPCEKNDCFQIQDQSYLGCLKSIQPDLVWKAIQSGISGMD